MKRVIHLLAVMVALVSCKKPYFPPVISGPNGYLVVEGAINSGSDSTFITLSRTVNPSTAFHSNLNYMPF